MRKPLSSVDLAWLRMEDPTNLMMINGVLVFGAPLEFERLRATIVEGLLCFDRFRQRVARPAVGLPYWEDDPDFDLDHHLQRASLPSPGDRQALQDLSSLLASRQLDFSRPLWQFHLVEEYRGGSALICRLHHCIGDGLALVHVLLSLTSSEPDAPWPAPQPTMPGMRSAKPRGRLLGPARRAVRAGCKVTSSLVQEGRQVLGDPSRLAQATRLGAGGVKALGRVLLLWPDPRTTFKGELDVPKRAVWSGPVPLEKVKAIGQGLGGTVNDILLTAMSGALRRYLVDRGDPADGVSFRAVVPVNLRKPGTEHELGNKFGLVFLSLPVGMAEPEQRLRALKQRMDALKGSLEAPVTFGILTAMGSTPEIVQDLAVTIFALKGTAVMTNVIGPREQIYLAGSPIESLMFWVPQSGHLGLGVSILSYNGQVRLGIITDEGLVPDPEKIVEAFHAEFDSLLLLSQAPERTTGVQAMMDKLDETLVELDSLLPKEAGVEDRPDGTGPAEEPAETCQALTQAGKPCKNRPMAGSLYCRVHQK